jgi:hypothetical protein
MDSYQGMASAMLRKKSGTADSSLVLTAPARLRTTRNDKSKDLTARLKPSPFKATRDSEFFRSLFSHADGKRLNEGLQALASAQPVPSAPKGAAAPNRRKESDLCQAMGSS